MSSRLWTELLRTITTATMIITVSRERRETFKVKKLITNSLCQRQKQPDHQYNGFNERYSAQQFTSKSNQNSQRKLHFSVLQSNGQDHLASHFTLSTRHATLLYDHTAPSIIALSMAHQEENVRKAIEDVPSRRFRSIRLSAVLNGVLKATVAHRGWSEVPKKATVPKSTPFFFPPIIPPFLAQIVSKMAKTRKTTRINCQEVDASIQVSPTASAQAIYSR